ncbi:hypothetical protein LTR95_010731 [Oleoguttula sp. CCFEE 5521]
MAIEAAKQLADPSKEISGFIIKNAVFHSPLSITANGSIDVNLYLRPLRDNNDKDEGLHDFRLYTHDDSGWHENCNGSIQIVTSADATEVDQGEEQMRWKDAHRLGYATATEACPEKVDIDWLYDRMVDNGYGYGPSFRAITALWHNSNDRTVTDVSTFKLSDHYDIPETALPHVIHPTTFDCILQGVLASYTRGGTKKMSTAILTHFERIWIANRGLSCADADQVKVFASTHRVGLRETDSTVVALDATCTDVLVEVKGFKTTDIDDVEADEEGKAKISANLCQNIDWKPDLKLLSPQETQSLCDSLVPRASGPSEFLRQVDFLLIAAIKRTMSKLSNQQIAALSCEPHTGAYVRWMQHKLSSLQDYSSSILSSEQTSCLEDSVYIEQVSAALAATNKQGVFYSKVASLHEELLTGKEDPLSVLFQGELVKDFYFEVWDTVPCVARFHHFLDSFAHKNPTCKVLEVGAGTGATTYQSMMTLTTHGDGEKCVPRYGTYEYTDVSPFFFATAQDTYRDHGSKMNFRALNIENDPEGQGFEPASYDMIVAAAVLHATKDLKRTMMNCRKLLKPGGQLVLWEITTPPGLRTNFAFGLLEGWWLSTEISRKLGPSVTEDTWDSIFRDTGFSGCDVVYQDYEDPACHEFGVMCTTAAPVEEKDPTEVITGEVVILHAKAQDQHLNNLRTDLDRLEHLSSAAILDGDYARVLESTPSVLIFVLELNGPVLHNVEEHLFETLRTLLTTMTVSSILWVARVDGQAASAPFSQMIHGLARTINSEFESSRVVCLTLAPTAGSHAGLTERQRAHIARLALLLRDGEILESEYTDTMESSMCPV